MIGEIGRLALVLALGTLAGLPASAAAAVKPAPKTASTDDPTGAEHLSRIALGDSLVRLVNAQVLVPAKLHAIYAQSGGIPAELAAALGRPAPQRIRLTRENAAMYVTLLWPIGLANRMRANAASPLNGARRFRFASVGGWTLGSAPNGGFDLNRHAIVALTPEQDARVARIARAVYRPCCDNSTFFQDCNHGSALLGLLALGAAQGLSDDDLYREALAFNAHWFPDQYRLTAVRFKSTAKLDWAQVDPRVVLSARYSSARGWRANVAGHDSGRGSGDSSNVPACSA